MSRRKTERLLNLVICLLSTRRYLSAEQIRAAVPGYPDSTEAFKRMFERDKDELRELGVPLEVGSDTGWEDDPGYRIRSQRYQLPEISLTADEAAVLGLAARVWRRANLAKAASGALLKLRAAGIEVDAELPLDIEPRVGTDEPAFPQLWRAVRDGRVVRFDYQTMGRVGIQTRLVEPWGVVSRNGHWYLAGHDRDRDATRVFRLGRIAGDVELIGPRGAVVTPPGTDVRALVRAAYHSGAPAHEQRVAHLRIRGGTGAGIRRWARVTGPPADGFEPIDADFYDVDWLAGYLVGLGPNVVVLDPPDLRDAVVQRLKAVVA